MKILIIRFSSLGDIILTQPVVKILKDEYQKSTISYLTKKIYFPIVEIFGCVDRVISLEDIDLKNESFDLVVDLHKKLNSLILRFKLNYSKYVSYDKKHFLRWLIVKKMTNKSIDSTVDLYASTLLKSDINKKYEYPKIYPFEKSVKKAEELLINYNLNFSKYKIAVFPGATHLTKMYPINFLKHFISSVPESWNCQFVIMGSYKEKELGLELKRKANRKVIEICGATNLELLPAVLSKMDAVISNDSGSMHIAAALGLPQIAIFGATHTNLGFRPLNEKAIILQSDIKCQPCSLHGGKYCKKGTFQCMTSINPSFLLENFKFLLEKYLIKV